ncbi:MAG: PQQ-dependent sugar dehydrogenase, partial [Ectothiorhodospira sp.]
MKRIRISLFSFSVLALSGAFAGAALSEASGASPDGGIVKDRVESEAATFRVVRVVDGLRHPWAVDWLPDGRMLITERGGTLYLVDDRQ